MIAWLQRSWTGFRLLHAIPEAARAWIGRRRATAAAWSAYREVPGYRALVAEHGLRPAMRFADFPLTDKHGYVERFGLAATCRGGRLPAAGVIDESSGAGGTASQWVRSAGERARTARVIRHAIRALVADREFVVLNAFALGPWATGMAVSMALADRHLVKSIGPDAAKVVATIRALGPGRPFLLAGYPPFLKLLCDTADLAWRDYEVYAVCGGEGMSEALRSALDRCFVKTVSSFGASDLEINIAAETPWTIAVRRALVDCPDLGRTLFHRRDGVPMVFQYDPLDYHLETTDAQDLVVTVNRRAASPRIRYNLRDRACVMPRARVAWALREHGIAIRERALPMPVLFHWGRQDHAVAFYGCKLTPEDLQQAVLEVPELATRVAELALRAYEDAGANRCLELWVELTPGATLAVTPALEDALLARLAAANQDFRESIKMVPAERRPRLRVFAAGTSPLANQDARIKRRYVVR